MPIRYFVSVRNACLDLRDLAKVGDVVDRIKIEVRDDGRRATFLLDWDRLLDSIGFKVAAAMASLDGLHSRNTLTPDDAVHVLSPCGIAFDPRETMRQFVGRPLAA
jgi:hypothetical protein